MQKYYKIQTIRIINISSDSTQKTDYSLPSFYKRYIISGIHTKSKGLNASKTISGDLLFMNQETGNMG